MVLFITCVLIWGYMKRFWLSFWGAGLVLLVIGVLAGVSQDNESDTQMPKVAHTVTRGDLSPPLAVPSKVQVTERKSDKVEQNGKPTEDTAVWLRQANHEIYQVLNRPEFVGKIMLESIECKSRECELRMVFPDKQQSASALIADLMHSVNQPDEATEQIRLAMSAIKNTPYGAKASLIYYRDVQSSPRYTAQQMSDAMRKASADKQPTQ